MDGIGGLLWAANCALHQVALVAGPGHGVGNLNVVAERTRRGNATLSPAAKRGLPSPPLGHNVVATRAEAAEPLDWRKAPR